MGQATTAYTIQDKMHLSYSNHLIQYVNPMQTHTKNTFLAPQTEVQNISATHHLLFVSKGGRKCLP